MPARYRYCADPVFLSACVLYLLNRVVFKPLALGHTVFFEYYGNDVLCIPFCLPPVLYLYRLLKIRHRDRYPTRFELVSHLIVWSLFFEWLGPVVLRGPFAWSKPDPYDVVAYIAGGAIAGGFWGTWSRARRTRPLPVPIPEETP